MHARNGLRRHAPPLASSRRGRGPLPLTSRAGRDAAQMLRRIRLRARGSLQCTSVMRAGEGGSQNRQQAARLCRCIIGLCSCTIGLCSCTIMRRLSCGTNAGVCRARYTALCWDKRRACATAAHPSSGLNNKKERQGGRPYLGKGRLEADLGAQHLGEKGDAPIFANSVLVGVVVHGHGAHRVRCSRRQAVEGRPLQLLQQQRDAKLLPAGPPGNQNAYSSPS